MYRFLFGPLTCGTIAITFGDWAATPPSTTSSSSRSSQQQHHATDSSNIGDKQTTATPPRNPVGNTTIDH